MATSSSSSVMSGIQVPQSRWDSSVSKGRRSMVRVNIPVPAPSFPLTRFHLPSVPAPAAVRWLGDVRDSNSIELYQNGNNNTVRKLKMMKKKKTSDAPKAWKGSASVSRSQQLKTWVPCCSSLSRNCYGKTTPFPTSTLTSPFFRQKSCFPLSAHTFKTHGNHIRPLCATVGPDEPHAASTALPDGLLEKQDLDLLYPQLQTAELEGFFSTELPSHPKLHRGQLKNGLRYLILPNKVPANRLEAHMEVHVGSIDEEDDEQGIAHMIEHVAFLGSKKREKLLGTGARSNAYTDFHHTVFHIHSPTSTKDADEDLLPLVLEALNEIAFHPKFLSSRVEKERRAILSELQMMNTIEYRVDCQLLQHLHSENKLSKRFPIGLEEQIKKWDADKIRKFHERWYFPANATLYIVGDINNISKTINQIEAVFEQTGLENETASPPTSSAFDQSKVLKKERHAVRPPIKHNWSLPGHKTDVKPPQIFQHELLQNFSINMFCKIPVTKVRTFRDLRNVLMKRIFLSALHFRINSRYK
ncbi:hypothetical protein V6N12_054206, partial [Hibiscus sabdariffa]